MRHKHPIANHNALRQPIKSINSNYWRFWLTVAKSCSWWHSGHAHAFIRRSFILAATNIAIVLVLSRYRQNKAFRLVELYLTNTWLDATDAHSDFNCCSITVAEKKLQWTGIYKYLRVSFCERRHLSSQKFDKIIHLVRMESNNFKVSISRKSIYKLSVCVANPIQSIKDNKIEYYGKSEETCKILLYVELLIGYPMRVIDRIFLTC